MDFDEILQNVKNWQKQMGMFHNEFGKIDHEQANAYEITNVPRAPVELRVWDSTPLNRHSSGVPLWEYLHQHTWLALGTIDPNLSENPIVITRK